MSIDKNENEKRFKERRKFVRIDVYAVTRFFSPTEEDEVGVQARVSDLSEGGALLLTFSQGIPVDTTISLSFVLPSEKGDFIEILGRVRHTEIKEKDIYRSGMEFLKIKGKEKRTIKEFVEARLKKKTNPKACQ